MENDIKLKSLVFPSLWSQIKTNFHRKTADMFKKHFGQRIHLLLNGFQVLIFQNVMKIALKCQKL